jgi:hypothetical protein
MYTNINFLLISIEPPTLHIDTHKREEKSLMNGVKETRSGKDEKTERKRVLWL